MSGELIFAITGTIIIALTFIVFIIKKLPRRIKRDKFAARWKKLQQHCRDKTSWYMAILEADDLLNEALKVRRFKGKSVGERLVAAEEEFSNKDGVWLAHNLSKKVDTYPDMDLKEDQVKKVLAEFRRALRDLRVLPEESKNA